ncbi:MAG: DUF480 domain-containing protein [Gammaproteobacteria bacterium]|nr:DUF480 domain-containing protein [Gammaproteobacteria bacterium]
MPLKREPAERAGLNTELDSIEVRVLGSLVEKDLATPDYYPMTVSALTNACNQKSNRDPVMSLSENQVLDALSALSQKHLAWEKGGAGGRVPRYAHKLAGTLTRTFDFSRRQLAVLAVLFLRGPQTPGELRSRTTRMCEFQDLDEVEEVLKELSERADGPYVVELPREPGRRETRYAHLFSGDVEPASQLTQASGAGPSEVHPELQARVSVLEGQVADLAEELAALRRRIDSSS